MDSRTKIIRSVAVVGFIISSVSIYLGVILNPQSNLDPCEEGQIALDYELDADGNPHSRVCLDEAQYEGLKAKLRDEFSDGSKNYDFDINLKSTLEAVLLHETYGHQNQLEEADRESLREFYVGLLDPQP